MKHGGAIYIMSNKNNTVLYIGVTSDLKRRVYEHKNISDPLSFTAKYNLFKLVYYECNHRIEDAIARETQLKGKSRKKKDDLINSVNPERMDLYDEVLGW